MDIFTFPTLIFPIPLTLFPLSYGHSNFLANLGFIVIGFTLLLFLAISLFFLRKMALKYSSRFSSLLTFISRKLFFSTFIRAFMQSYFNLMVTCCITVQSYPLFQTISFKQFLIDILQASIVIIVLFFPYFCLCFLRKNLDQLDNLEFQMKFGSFY